jgi:hypothetical protein
MAHNSLAAEPAATVDFPAANCLVSWKGPDGRMISIGPMARERADQFVRAHASLYPGQPCWIQPVHHEVESLRLGRVTRRRSSARDH